MGSVYYFPRVALLQEHLATQTCKIQSAASDPELNAVVAVSPKQRGEMQQPGCSDSSNVCCRGASCPNGPWQRQARRRRPGSRTLANPFALRRELLPTSPKYLDTSTSATPIACHAPVSLPYPPRLVLTSAVASLKASSRSYTFHAPLSTRDVFRTATP